jgi:hypothetical protein
MTLPRGTLRFSIALAVLALCAASPRVARAEEATDDQAHIQRGVELRRTGRDREALDEFEAAWALRKTPRARAQIGLAQQALGHWRDAESALDEALAASGDEWIARYRGSLQKARSVVQNHLAWLYVESKAVGATLSMDGQPDRTLPLDAPLRVEAGDVRFVLQAPGYASAVRTIVVKPNDHVHEIVELAPAADNARASTGAAAVGDASVAPTPGLENGSQGGGDHRTAGILTFGGAALLALAGVGAWRVRVNDVLAYNDNSRCLVGGQDRDQNCSQFKSGASVAEVVEVASFSASVVVAGVATWLLATSHGKPRVGASCSPWLGVGVACSGSF